MSLSKKHHLSHWIQLLWCMSKWSKFCVVSCVYTSVCVWVCVQENSCEFEATAVKDRKQAAARSNRSSPPLSNSLTLTVTVSLESLKRPLETNTQTNKNIYSSDRYSRALAIRRNCTYASGGTFETEISTFMLVWRAVNCLFVTKLFNT